MADAKLLIDDKALDRLLGVGGEAFLLKMAKLFRDHSRGQLELGLSAYAAGQDDEAEKAVHSIRSSAGNLGAMQLFKLAGEIERELREGPRPGPERLEQLQQLFDASLRELAQRVPGMTELA